MEDLEDFIYSGESITIAPPKDVKRHLTFSKEGGKEMTLDGDTGNITLNGKRVRWFPSWRFRRFAVSVMKDIVW